MKSRRRGYFRTRLEPFEKISWKKLIEKVKESVCRDDVYFERLPKEPGAVEFLSFNIVCWQMVGMELIRKFVDKLCLVRE